MQRVLVTGGNGGLGRELVPLLLAQGYGVRVMSRQPASAAPAAYEWAQADLTTGAGLAAALAHVDTVVHAASSAFNDTQQTDVDGTQRLITQARAAGVQHIVYISIVGIERIPFAYYRSKLAAEHLIEQSNVPWTIARATQFHSLIDTMLRRFGRGPLLPVPTSLQFQTIDTGEAAAQFVQWVAAGPSGHVPDVGGPEVLHLGAMARAWRAAQGRRPLLVPLPALGRFAQSVRAGYNTCPERRIGRVTWAEWLTHTYRVPAQSSPAHTL